MLHSNPTVSSPSLDLDVPVLPEASPPGVLHQPVVHTPLAAVAHHGDLVVQSPDTVRVADGLTAPVVVEDSAAVVSEVCCLERNEVRREISQIWRLTSSPVATGAM